MENSPLALFEHEKFGSLRVVRSDQGAQWFVAKDVCGCLGLDTSNLSKMLDEDELSTYPVQYTDQVRNLSVVSEPGLYSLILRSRKPEAKAFKRWVTHDILPSIRKTGQYGGIPDFTDPVAAARAWAESIGCRAGISVEIMVDKPGDIYHCAFVPLTRDIQRLSL